MLLVMCVWYVFAGALVKSVNPAGVVDWRGRRYRKGGIVALVLLFALCEIAVMRQDRIVGLGLSSVLYAAIALAVLFVGRWWYHDARKEEAARVALIESLGEERLESLLPMSRGKKIWRWVVNAYAIFLVAALVYGVVRYLLTKI
ncbi:MAG TPA: hypothetical protein VFX12_03830 [Vicinamibacterales bacterium]|nr:hypothetical protein [Vicinamibacterales bacterium]